MSDARGYVNARDNAGAYAQVKAELAAHGRLDNELRACDAITSTTRHCQRRAVVVYTVTPASWNAWGGEVAYCAQHDKGAGVSRMLKPFPWEVTGERRLGRKA